MANQDIWQELYQKYSYAFKDYEDFTLILENYFNKRLDDLAFNEEYYLKGARKHIINIIQHHLADNKIDILLNYITSNIDPNNDASKELAKLINWFNLLNYTPVPNVIIDLIEQSPIFKNLVAKLVDTNFAQIKKYGLNKVFDDDLIILFVEIYCTLNNIDLAENNNALVEEEQKDSYFDSTKEMREDISNYMPTGVDAFFAEIKKRNLEVLTKEEEYFLLTKIKQGDQEAYKYFYEHNCRLVISIAKRYRHSRVDYEDLLQEGCIGLMTAIERFELERGFKFSTYATWWIRQAILRAINIYGKKTGVSINKNEELSQYRKKLEKYADELGRWPTDKEIAEYLGISLMEVQENNQLLLTDCSINQSINSEENEELGDFLKDDNIKIESDFITHNLAMEMQDLFKKAGLTEQEIIILNYRWGLNGCEEKTLSEVGKLFDFTRERARQYEANAIKKLRKYAGTKDFALYLDSPDKAVERLRKLATWHFNNPQSYIIYDIDLSSVRLDVEKAKKEPPIESKKKKTENYLYKILKSYKKEDIDAVVETLSEDEKKILDIRNDYYNNPSVYSSWNNDIIKQSFRSILSKIYYRLNKPDKKNKLSTIYDFAFCKNHSKEEIDLAIYMLDYSDKEIIKLRYGTDLTNPIVSSEWDYKKFGDIFYEKVIPNIINNLKIIQQQNKEIEEKIRDLYSSDEIDSTIKKIYVKALRLLKLPEIKLLLQEFSSKEAIIFALYLLKYFEGIEFNVEDYIEIIEINREGLNECIKKSLLFMKEHLEEFALMKDKLYCREEKKLSRK